MGFFEARTPSFVEHVFMCREQHVEQCAKCVSRMQRHFDTYRSNGNHYRHLLTRCGCKFS